MHCSIPSYIGDLVTFRFGMCRSPRTNAPLTPRDGKFWESQKLYEGCWLHVLRGIATPNPCVVQRSCVSYERSRPESSLPCRYWSVHLQVISCTVAWLLNRICRGFASVLLQKPWSPGDQMLRKTGEYYLMKIYRLTLLAQPMFICPQILSVYVIWVYVSGFLIGPPQNPCPPEPPNMTWLGNRVFADVMGSDKVRLG